MVAPARLQQPHFLQVFSLGKSSEQKPPCQGPLPVSSRVLGIAGLYCDVPTHGVHHVPSSASQLLAATV